MPAAGWGRPGADGGSGQVRVVGSGAVATVELGTGARRNSLGLRDWSDLAALAGELSADPPDVVVLRGAGHTFCSGFDLREWVDACPAHVDATFAAMERALRAVEAVPVPTVAVVHGVATGAGCQLVLACDLQVVSADATLGMPIARHGILVSAPFALRLALAVGPARARELLYTGRLLHGADAGAIGLVTHVRPDADVQRCAEELITGLRAQPSRALRAAKHAVRAGLAPLRRAADAEPAAPAADEWFPQRVADFLDRAQAPRPVRPGGGPAQGPPPA